MLPLLNSKGESCEVFYLLNSIVAYAFKLSTTELTIGK